MDSFRLAQLGRVFVSFHTELQMLTVLHGHLASLLSQQRTEFPADPPLQASDSTDPDRLHQNENSEQPSQIFAARTTTITAVNFTTIFYFCLTGKFFQS